MWYIVQIDMGIPYPIRKDNKPSKYGELKLFPTKKKAKEWVDRHSYSGMSWRYEIKKELG